MLILGYECWNKIFMRKTSCKWLRFDHPGPADKARHTKCAFQLVAFSPSDANCFIGPGKLLNTIIGGINNNCIIFTLNRQQLAARHLIVSPFHQDKGRAGLRFI
jgi:hypothetical protein